MNIGKKKERGGGVYTAAARYDSQSFLSLGTIVVVKVRHTIND